MTRFIEPFGSAESGCYKQLPLPNNAPSVVLKSYYDPESGPGAGHDRVKRFIEATSKKSESQEIVTIANSSPKQTQKSKHRKSSSEINTPSSRNLQRSVSNESLSSGGGCEVKTGIRVRRSSTNSINNNQESSFQNHPF